MRFSRCLYGRQSALLVLLLVSFACSAPLRVLSPLSALSFGVRGVGRHRLVGVEFRRSCHPAATARRSAKRSMGARCSSPPPPWRPARRWPASMAARASGEAACEASLLPHAGDRCRCSCLYGGKSAPAGRQSGLCCARPIAFITMRLPAAEQHRGRPLWLRRACADDPRWLHRADACSVFGWLLLDANAVKANMAARTLENEHCAVCGQLGRAGNLAAAAVVAPPVSPPIGATISAAPVTAGRLIFPPLHRSRRSVL